MWLMGAGEFVPLRSRDSPGVESRKAAACRRPCFVCAHSQYGNLVT